MNHLKYRADIDGLRALSIVSVVIFHFFSNILQGGFVGVDVFFVISGYLISSIIFQNINNNSFNFIEFYIRRIKRIFPALILVLVFCYIFGWFALLDNEFMLLGKHIASASIFISNFILLNESGYFDVLSDTKPLLHLWSLAIEEQFYLFWPLFIYLFYKRKVNFGIIIISVTLCSFLASLLAIKTDHIASFYLPYYRFWELLSGAFIAWLFIYKFKNFHDDHIKKSKIKLLFLNTLSFIGFAILIYSFVRINKKLLFPGIWALFPVMGALMVISAGPMAWLNQKILSNRILVWIGLISFPLYLWHWPIYSFAYILEDGHLSIVAKIILIIISLIFSWLTYKFIETPIRFRIKNNIKIVIVLLFCLLSIGAIGYLTYYNKGITSRNVVSKNFNNNDYNTTYDKIKCEGLNYFDDDMCYKIEVQNPIKKIVLYGDSTATAWLPVFVEIAKKKNYSLILLSHPSCPPILGARKTSFPFPKSRKYCSDGKIQQEALDYINLQNVDYIILLGAWNAYSKKMNREFITACDDSVATSLSTEKTILSNLPMTISRLSKISKLIVFKSWPQFQEKPKYKVKRIEFLQFTNQFNTFYPAAEFRAESQIWNNIFNSFISSKNILFYDPTSKTCDKNKCYSNINNIELYQDGYHITSRATFEFRSDIENLLED